MKGNQPARPNPPPASPEDRLSIRDLPDDERPRERLLRQGAAALSTAELLAILLRTGTARENVMRLAERLLAQCGGLHGLTQVTPEQLQAINGLGEAKATQILAAVELGRRLASRPNSDRAAVHSAADAARLVDDMRHLPQEHIRVILLDSARQVIAIPTVYIGTVSLSVLRVPELFREAIARSAAALVIAHNHPSGDPAPSPEDVEVTRSLVAAGNLLELPVLDHIIVARRGWRSLKDLGLGF